MCRLHAAALLLACFSSFVGQGSAQSDQVPSSKTWVGRNADIEEYLKNGECVSLRWFAKDFAAQCTLRPGGPIAKMAWRPRPGTHRGFRESYKTEIAAYELDKLLKMDMVPPTVERQLEGSNGAAQQWVENVVDARDPAVPTGENRIRWEKQLVQMMMFDNLIGNRERNRGNMLRDATWSLILIDHSRAFGVDTRLLHKPSGTDDAYWNKIESLSRKQLDESLRTWLEPNEIDAIIGRRERMRAELKSQPK